MFKIEKVPLESLKAWERNPRERDPERFEWIQLSLKKFGFITPVYARREDGMLYSGHQRTGAAAAIGMTEVPVVYVETSDDRETANRAINIVFNLCTNDHSTKSDFGKAAAKGLSASILDTVRELPDAVDPYPCLSWYNVSPLDFMDQLTLDRVNNTTKLFADEFTSKGIDIPIVVDSENRIINGLARLLSAVSYGRASFPAVRVTQNATELEAFLNKITMSFDLKRAFGEELRYNSFFRRRNQAAQRTTLGVGFYHWVFMKDAQSGGKSWLLQNMVKLEGKNRDRWIAEHGTTVIDFGAGRLDNTVKLQAAGINCIPFEPYLLKPKSDRINPQAARLVSKRFLDWVARREPLDSVFCSSVFNSVPFKEDRDHLMVIFQALCCRGAKLYLHTLNDRNLGSKIFANGLSDASRSDGAILLDSEPGLYINEVLNVAKVQKYHSPEELMALGRQHFYKVDYFRANGSSHGIRCQGIKPIDWVALRSALEFEFDLPYPEDQRMGLVPNAIAAFSKYCNVEL